MNRGDHVRIVPADDLDPDATAQKFQEFVVIRTRDAGINTYVFVHPPEDERKIRVFRLQDVKLCQDYLKKN